MAKKNFKSGLNNLFNDNADEIKQVSGNDETEISTNINLDDISDEKLKWLLIKLQRYEKELKLWRTGQLTKEKFLESLKDFNLTYDDETNEIIAE